MATKAKQEVATTGGQLPAYLAPEERRSGLKGLDTTDFIIPRVKLLQKISPEVETFNNAVPGIFWLNVLDQPLGSTLDFIPISNRKRYLLMAPMGGSPKGILARADDGVHWKPAAGEWQVSWPKGPRKPVTWKTAETVRESGLGEFGTQDPDNPDSNPAATLFYEYLVYLPDHPELSPVLLSFARSQAKRARDLNGKIEFRKAPMQSQRLRMSITDEARSDSEKYSNVAFAANGWATETEFKACKQYAATYVDYQGADEEGAVNDELGGASGGKGADEKEF